MTPNTLINKFNSIHDPFKVRIIEQKVQLISASNGAESVHFEVSKAVDGYVVRTVNWLSWSYKLEIVSEFLRLAEKILRSSPKLEKKVRK